jgi:hypothetical protein
VFSLSNELAMPTPMCLKQVPVEDQTRKTPTTPRTPAVASPTSTSGASATTLSLPRQLSSGSAEVPLPPPPRQGWGEPLTEAVVELSLQFACVHGFRPDHGLNILINIHRIHSCFCIAACRSWSKHNAHSSFWKLTRQGGGCQYASLVGISPSREHFSALVMGSRDSGHDMVCKPAWKSRAQKTLPSECLQHSSDLELALWRGGLKGIRRTERVLSFQR